MTHAGPRPLSTAIDCWGHSHTITSAGDQLLLHDHDEREDVLAVLGGALPPCLEIRMAWRLLSKRPPNHWDSLVTLLDETTLTVAERDKVVARASLVSPGGMEHLFRLSRTVGGTEEQFAEARKMVDVARALLVALRLPPPMRRLLGERVLSRMLSGSRWEWQEALNSATIRIATRSWSESAQSWLEAGVAVPDPEWNIGLPGMGARLGPPTGGEGVTVELPLDWMRDVWMPGLAVIDGRFVLSAGSVEARTHVQVVEWRDLRRGGPVAEVAERHAVQQSGTWSIAARP
ncbi:MAG TPA: hypothetical protein VNE62_06905 [Actinomycetota bacterium]|nr:hypothetical protein [Actinomycetota bacterium]